MRDSCADCVRKHLSQAFVLATKVESDRTVINVLTELGQAEILMAEFATGDYDLHLWFAVGHIAVLENCFIEHGQLNEAAILRQIRIKIMEDEEYIFSLKDAEDKLGDIGFQNLSYFYNKTNLIAKIKSHILESYDESLKDFPAVADLIMKEYKSIEGIVNKCWIEFKFADIIQQMGVEYDALHPLEDENEDKV